MAVIMAPDIRVPAALKDAVTQAELTRYLTKRNELLQDARWQANHAAQKELVKQLKVLQAQQAQLEDALLSTDPQVYAIAQKITAALNPAAH